ncbi:MAG TPA: FecR domain-containing protein [Bacteroidales bacterium]|nr:FecR domain-containing protein [Bacteroidales bacterium]
MKNILPEHITIELLVSYIEGNADNTAKDVVNRWINENPRNRAYMDRFKEAWINTEELSTLSNETINSDWNALLGKIDTGKQKSADNKTARLNTYRWLRVAGILLLLVSIPLGYFIGKKNSRPVVQNSQVAYNEIIVPPGERSELALSDGSRIWINAGSRLRFPDRFNEDSRDVWLDGEGYFEISRDRVRPFYVHTSDLNVKVYGTKFNLKAYSQEDIIEATLVEGKVSLETKNLLNNKIEEVFLKPNHKAIYLKKETQLISAEIIREISKPLEPKKIIVTRTIEVEPSISWREGKLVFMDESFDNIAIKLERRFGVKLVIDNEELKKIRYTGVLKNISVEQALKAIQLTAPFRYDIRDNTIIISESKPKANQ